MSPLPALPSIANAKFPQTYEHAKDALAKCSSLDECADWTNKAEAMASYAKQANDPTLHKMADRIKARAIRRCGELLRAIRPASGGDRGGPTGGRTPIGLTRTSAAREAGLSDDRRKTALRVANMPASDFEDAVESEHPPSLKALAEQGRRPSIAHLQGRDPKEFARATEARGYLRRLAEFAAAYPPEIIARGSLPHDRRGMQQRIDAIQPWLGTLNILLGEAGP